MPNMYFLAWCVGVVACVVLLVCTGGGGAAPAQEEVQFPLPVPNRFQKIGKIDTEIGYECRLYLQTKPHVCYAIICDGEYGFKQPAMACTK